jgi:hypothetical protein
MAENSATSCVSEFAWLFAPSGVIRTQTEASWRATDVNRPGRHSFVPAASLAAPEKRRCPGAVTSTAQLLTSHFSLLTSHFSLLTSHFSLPTSHFPLPTSHFSLLTSHFSLLTSHFPLPTSHFPLPTSHFSLLTSHFSLPQCVPKRDCSALCPRTPVRRLGRALPTCSTLETEPTRKQRSAQKSRHDSYRGIDIPRSPSHFPLPTSHFPLLTSHFPLPTSHFPLPTSHFPLPTSHFPLPTSNFQLPTSHFPLLTSNFQLPTSNFQLPQRIPKRFYSALCPRTPVRRLGRALPTCSTFESEPASKQRSAQKSRHGSYRGIDIPRSPSHFPLPTSHFPLPTSHFLLPTSYFLLPTSPVHSQTRLQ